MTNRINHVFDVLVVFNVQYLVCVNAHTDLLLSHLGELVQEGKVLSQVFAVWLDTVLHDGQEGLNKAGDAGSAADILHWTVHVVRAEQKDKLTLIMMR